MVNPVVPHESLPFTASAPGAVSDAPSAPAGEHKGQERQGFQQEQEQEQDDKEDKQ